MALNDFFYWKCAKSFLCEFLFQKEHSWCEGLVQNNERVSGDTRAETDQKFHSRSVDQLVETKHFGTNGIY